MTKLNIITDSTAYLPQEFLDKYQISVAPMVLIWGDETFEDGVDILPGEFYARLKNAKIMPSTSQATPKSFVELYTQLSADGKPILAILLSPSLSGTIPSAIQAQDFVPEAKVEIVDAQTTAMALGFQVIAAARAAADGASLEECKALAEKASAHTGVVFAVDTLEFLHRGGRIGTGSRFLGTALNVKPILEIVNGRIEAIERVRTRKKSVNRLLELVEDRVAGRKPLRLSILHADAEEDAIALMEKAKEYFDCEEIFISEVSPVIGTHAGPGTVGIAYMAGL